MNIYNTYLKLNYTDGRTQYVSFYVYSTTSPGSFKGTIDSKVYVYDDKLYDYVSVEEIKKPETPENVNSWVFLNVNTR